jgi:hypothetical protein
MSKLSMERKLDRKHDQGALQKISNNRTIERRIGAMDHLYVHHEKPSHPLSISCTAKLSSSPHPA